MKSTSNMIIFI